jgi:hypothetical protein
MILIVELPCLNFGAVIRNGISGGDVRCKDIVVPCFEALAIAFGGSALIRSTLSTYNEATEIQL